MRRWVADSPREEVADRCRDLIGMGLEREVAGVEEVDLRTGNGTPERLGAARQEEGTEREPYADAVWRKPLSDPLRIIPQG